jgi:purine-binding chemotaxis protein CheW
MRGGALTIEAVDERTPRAASRAPPAPPLPAPGRDAIVELCAFRVGHEEYVIDLRRIREILQPLPITPVPRAPEFVEGVMSLRGEIVPVVDVRKRLGMLPRPLGSDAEAPAPRDPAVRPGARPKVLLVNVAGHVLGLVVDAVSEVLRIPRSAIGPPPLLAPSAQRLFLGVCGGRDASGPAASRQAGARPARGRLRLLLNVKALLDPTAPAAGAAGGPTAPSEDGER